METGIKFTKMHGTGNDYVFVNGFEQEVSDPEAFARVVSDRHFGVGGDGLILILPSEKADVRMRIFNADGSEAEMCGNGIRCVAKYVYERRLIPRRKRMRIETAAGVRAVELDVRGSEVEKVRVSMGKPRLERTEVPMLGPAGEVILEPLEVDGRSFEVTALSMGNPHCVIFVERASSLPLDEIGPKIENHKRFPQRTNVEFVEVQNRNDVRVRVWERGSGETLACGTGAAAVCVAGAITGKTARKVRVHLDGGDLELDWPEDGEVYLTGPAVEVFDGVWLLGKDLG